VIIRRHEEGLTIREIAAEQRLPKTTVQDALARTEVARPHGGTTGAAAPPVGEPTVKCPCSQTAKAQGVVPDTNVHRTNGPRSPTSERTDCTTSTCSSVLCGSRTSESAGHSGTPSGASSALMILVAVGWLVGHHAVSLSILLGSSPALLATAATICRIHPFLPLRRLVVWPGVEVQHGLYHRGRAAPARPARPWTSRTWTSRSPCRRRTAWRQNQFADPACPRTRRTCVAVQTP
jgi:hypothetical protein